MCLSVHYQAFEIDSPKPTFHTFEAEHSVIAINYATAEDATIMHQV